MIRFTNTLLTVIIAMNLAGCVGVSLPDLPDDAIAFEMGKFVDADDDDEAYGTIEYEGRTYIGYGTLAKSLTGKDIDECVGYIIMDENSSSVTDLNN